MDLSIGVQTNIDKRHVFSIYERINLVVVISNSWLRLSHGRLRPYSLGPPLLSPHLVEQ